MKCFREVERQFGHLDYMRHAEAELMRDFIVRNDSKDILEIGFFHGKSSAYIAAILEDAGRGHLVTVDRHTARQRQPNVQEVLSALNLEHRVTPVYAERSYTWELANMIRAEPRRQFDLCYFDGGHTWDATGFGFLLVDVLLRPGGWIVFDDLKWTIDNALASSAKAPKHWLACSEDERATPAVQLVFDLLVPHLGYTDCQTINDGQWGLARKPTNHRQTDPAEGLSAKISQWVRGR